MTRFLAMALLACCALLQAGCGSDRAPVAKFKLVDVTGASFGEAGATA